MPLMVYLLLLNVLLWRTVTIILLPITVDITVVMDWMFKLSVMLLATFLFCSCCSSMHVWSSCHWVYSFANSFGWFTSRCLHCRWCSIYLERWMPYSLHWLSMSRLHKGCLQFFLIQVRIRIEMAFGLLTTKWQLLKQPLGISLNVVAEVLECISQLHNFCIDMRSPDWQVSKKIMKSYQ